MGLDVRLLAALVCLAASVPAAADGVDFDQGVDLGAVMAEAAPAPPPLGQGTVVRDLTDLGADIDPTSMPYPHGAEDMRREQERVAAWVAERASALPPRQASVLADARAAGVSDVDLFHGSHVVVKDAGALYERWSAEGASPRISSHYRGLDVQQYEVRLEGIGVLLFGKDWSGDTWFQLEPFGATPEDALPHVVEYVRHEVTGGMNVGPLGLSPYTDARGTALTVAAPALAAR